MDLLLKRERDMFTISYLGSPVVESLCSFDKTVCYYLGECPKCRGDLVRDREIIGKGLEEVVKCLNCGKREHELQTETNKD